MLEDLRDITGNDQRYSINIFEHALQDKPLKITISKEFINNFDKIFNVIKYYLLIHTINN
ncbi:hypothetical protein [Caldicellulosiruptor acetigenus]|uniref:hypothetical protein n=1 Tax=Caldicellulosiruptor acetigenus TaxID=301953 RepID=UPI00041E2E08|nr:hypothetical protein [Caldicellulosiruptor acetigenus]WAM35837.1 hypothetical protein OTK01_002201 [Caldicellulosiruptor acetigenus]